MSIERDLATLRVAWPPTPDLATAWAGKRPDTGPLTAHGRRRQGLRPALAPAVAPLIALVVVATAVSPVRAKIGDFLGISGGETIKRAQTVPNGPRLGLGRRITLAQARAQIGLPIGIPARLGTPDAVYADGDLGPYSVALVWSTDTVLTEMLDVDVQFAVKELGPGVRFRYVQSLDGFWIGHGPRALLLTNPTGGRVVRRSVLPGSGVLLWDVFTQGRYVGYRLETRRPYAEALAIAHSVPQLPQ